MDSSIDITQSVAERLKDHPGNSLMPLHEIVVATIDVLEELGYLEIVQMDGQREEARR